jgi:hypothetical protein
MYLLVTHISGVLVSVLAPSAVDRGFEPRSRQTKDYKVGICCFSAKHTAFKGIVAQIDFFLFILKVANIRCFILIKCSEQEARFKK